MTLAPIDENENIDHSCWLPKGEPVLQLDKNGIPYRKDLTFEFRDDGQLRFIQSQVQNIMNWLYERDKIDKKEMYNGQTYEIWWRAYQGANGLIPRTEAISLESVGGISGEQGFILLLVRMEKNHHDMIQRALGLATSDERFMAQRNERHYQRAFERLTKLIPDILDTLKASRENEIKKQA